MWKQGGQSGKSGVRKGTLGGTQRMAPEVCGCSLTIIIDNLTFYKTPVYNKK